MKCPWVCLCHSKKDATFNQPSCLFIKLNSQINLRMRGGEMNWKIKQEPDNKFTVPPNKTTVSCPGVWGKGSAWDSAGKMICASQKCLLILPLWLSEERGAPPGFCFMLSLLPLWLTKLLPADSFKAAAQFCSQLKAAGFAERARASRSLGRSCTGHMGETCWRWAERLLQTQHAVPEPSLQYMSALKTWAWAHKTSPAVCAAPTAPWCPFQASITTTSCRCRWESGGTLQSPKVVIDLPSARPHSFHKDPGWWRQRH